MKKIVWCFIDKNSFVNNNRFLKSKHMEWSSNWTITILFYFVNTHSKFVIGTEDMIVIQDDKFI
jgi:hypothetical protein